MPIIRHGYSTTPRRKGSTNAWRKARAQVLVAAKYTCAICGQPARHDDPLEVDHIIPHAYGGTDHPHNLRAAHRTCNRRRGTGGAGGPRKP